MKGALQPWRPAIPDRAGRGALCERIQQLTREVLRYRPGGPAEDSHELNRVLARLDRERAEFHKLYGRAPKPVEVAHG